MYTENTFVLQENGTEAKLVLTVAEETAEKRPCVQGHRVTSAMESYPEIDVSDRRQLLDDEGSARSRSRVRALCHSWRWCVGIWIILACIILGHALSIYYIYFRCNHSNCVGVKVLTLNTWGMPASLGSQFKTERMKAIAQELSRGDHDIYLLQELWMNPDWNTLHAALPSGYYMTGFRDLALGTCDGRVGPEFCSGLTIVSKYPFLEKEFNSYTYHGDPLKSWIDAEWLARKGVGRVRIEPLPGMVVDVFVTHTAADPDPSHGYDNRYYRIRQVQELMDTYVTHSEADVVLLGGDFNAGPNQTAGEPYAMVKDHMQNCIEEVFYKLLEWLNPQYATYGNQKNTFSNHYTPIIYDYIFHHTRDPNVVRVWTNLFELPFFKFFLKKDHEISFSDHEAVEATIYMWKKW
eukprot:maker-scaffold478_size161223-snap-gene-0.27 protein:Tk02255 transcript:maker-scaffold478_size161223-snap-gene-0.27-mRNA-1 annotation:"neutral sphingomyelinase"